MSSSLSSLFSVKRRKETEDVYRRLDERRSSLDLERAEAAREMRDRQTALISAEPLEMRRIEKIFSRNGVVIVKDCRRDASIDLPELASHESKIVEALKRLQINFTGDSNRKRKFQREEDVAFRFEEVASRCFGRLDIRLLGTRLVARRDAVVEEVIARLLGEDSGLVYAGLISSFAGSFNQLFHADGPHLFGPNHQLPPHAINVFLPLGDVTDELGPTEFFCQSHKLERAKRLGKCIDQVYQSPDQRTSLECLHRCIQLYGSAPVKPLLTERDILFYDFRTVHRGTENVGKETRRMLYLLYTKNWFKDHINFGQTSIFGDGAASAYKQQFEANAKDRYAPGFCHFETMK